METTKESKVKCGERLKAIAPAVTKEDRKEAMKEFDMSYQTIHRYMNKCDVRNLDVGTRLYDFFKKRIDTRHEILA